MTAGYDAVLEAERAALRRITAGEDVGPAPKGPTPAPDIRRRYGEYITSQYLGNGGYMHGHRGPSN